MVAARIKYLREQKGLSQTEPAGTFKVSTDYLLCVDNTSTISTQGLTQQDIQLVHSLICHLKAKNQQCDA